MTHKPVFKERTKMEDQVRYSLEHVLVCCTTKSGPRLMICQLPSMGAPRLKKPERIGTISGAPLRMIEPRILKRLARIGVKISETLYQENSSNRAEWRIDEMTALHLGLLFRVLSSMENPDEIRAATEALEQMETAEAAYWLGMIMHRGNPQRVADALRMILLI